MTLKRYVFAQHTESGDLVRIPCAAERRSDGRHLFVGTASFTPDQAATFLQTLQDLLDGTLLPPPTKESSPDDQPHD